MSLRILFLSLSLSMSSPVRVAASWSSQGSAATLMVVFCLFFLRGSNSFFFKLKVWNFEEKVECNHWSCGGPLDERPRGGNKGEGEQQRKGFCSWGHAQKKGNCCARPSGGIGAFANLRICEFEI
jgi:hypothetical protein